METVMKRKSRTQKAVDLVDKGFTAYAAAAKLGIHRSNVTRALQARLAKPVGPSWI